MKKQTTLIKPPFFYGWIMVMVAGLGMFFSGPGQTYSNAVFIDSYIDEFGWSRSYVSSIYSIATLIAGFAMFFVGRFIDKYGHRFMATVIATLLALACFWNSAVTGPIMLFIGFMLIRLLGQGSMTLISNTLVPQWFYRYRGRALSLMAIGGFISASLFPPLNAWLIATFGWQTAWQIWGVLLLLIFVPVAWVFIRNRPEDIGSYQDGMHPNDLTFMQNKKNTASKEVSWTVKEAMKTRAFWLILVCVGIPSMVNTGITFHMFSILGEHGMSIGVSALVLSLWAVFGFPSNLLAGFLIEKIQIRYLFSFAFLAQIGVMLLLLYAHSPTLAITFGILRGLVEGVERICISIIWPDYFGREHLGSIKGLAMTITVIGSAFGPLPFALGYDLTGGYTTIIIIMMGFPIIGALLAWCSPKPQKDTLVS